MTCLGIFPVNRTRVDPMVGVSDVHILSGNLSLPFSAAFSTRWFENALDIRELKETPRKIMADRGVKPWAGTTPVLGGSRRPKPPKTRSHAPSRFRRSFPPTV